MIHRLLSLILLVYSAQTLAQQPTTHKYHKRLPTGSSSSPDLPQLLPMTAERAFLYYIAIYGVPDNVVDRYASYFDASNYKRAMADEFERGRYRTAMQAKIADQVRRLDFNDKFTLVGSATNRGYTSLGEYSFENHSFPINNIPTTGFCIDAGRTFFGNCTGTVLHVDVFRLEDAVNATDFTWSLPMPETEASAFVRNRTAGSGGVDRNVTVRITYSVVNMKGKAEDSVHGQAASFKPVIYSVEVFADARLTRKLGVIPRSSSAAPSTAEEWHAVSQTAQTASTVIGKYQYTAACREYYRCVTPIVGTITLTEVGIELSGEHRDGSATPMTRRFFDAFAGSSTKLWRANYTNGTWGGHDFRVVWPPFWDQDYHSDLVFAGQEERDRFFLALTTAVQEWSVKYEHFARAKLDIDQRCEINTRLGPCPAPSLDAAIPAPSTPDPGTPSVARAVADAGPLSVEAAGTTIAAGGTAVLKVKGNFASPGYVFLRDGTVSVGKAGITLAFSINGSVSTSTVSPDKILKLTQKPQYIYLRVLERDWNGKDRKEDYFLYHANAVTRGVASDGHVSIGYFDGNIICNGCDDSMNVLYALLEKVRGKG